MAVSVDASDNLLILFAFGMRGFGMCMNATSISGTIDDASLRDAMLFVSENGFSGSWSALTAKNFCCACRDPFVGVGVSGSGRCIALVALIPLRMLILSSSTVPDPTLVVTMLEGFEGRMVGDADILSA